MSAGKNGSTGRWIRWGYGPWFFVSVLGALVASPLIPLVARSEGDCVGEAALTNDCSHLNADRVIAMPTGETTEMEVASPATDGSAGFSISIEGETIAGNPAPYYPQRKADIRLAEADIDVRYTGLDVTPRLNVLTSDMRIGYRAGEQVTFRASTNYPAYISASEVRVIETGTGVPRTIARLPVRPNGQVQWVMPSEGAGQYAYVVRAYDANGRFNETIPKPLQRITSGEVAPKLNGPIVAAGEGEDATAVRNIPIQGGAVTVAGTGATGQRRVIVMGEAVPVDAEGAFVTERILPVGTQEVAVTVQGPNAPRQDIVRELDIPNQDLLYTAIADVTLGQREDGSAQGARTSYVDGRLAGYVTGRFANGARLTASADTGDGPLRDIFRRLDEKDPRSVLNRLGADGRTYLTYGDDSTAADTTPTSGRVYVSLAKDGHEGLWGDFNGNLGRGTAIEANRDLYGARYAYASPQSGPDGGPRFSAMAYAASPDMLPQRDVLPASGGSAYFLTRRDIHPASEVIEVQVQNESTGRIVDRVRLQAGVDYDLDPIQGIVILSKPLASYVQDAGLSVGSSIDAARQVLVAQYEYTPAAGRLEGASLGGEARGWLSTNVEAGVAVLSEQTGGADQRAGSAWVTYHHRENSTLRAEIAQSEGPGFGYSQSLDGGLTVTDEATAGSTDTRANSMRIDGTLDFADIGLKRDGQLHAYGELTEAGFATLSQNTAAERRLLGLEAKVEISPNVTLGIAAETFDEGDRSEDSGRVALSYQLSPTLKVAGELATFRKDTPGDGSRTGRRDTAAARVTWTPNTGTEVYGFAQGTLRQAGGLNKDDRVGLGGSLRFRNGVTFSGEVSDGTTGAEAQLSAGYQLASGTELYMAYALDPNRAATGAGRDNGTLTFGGRREISDRWRMHAEHRLDLWGENRSLTRAYGVEYTPSEVWTWSAGMEAGEVTGASGTPVQRTALSFGFAHTPGDGQSARLRAEWRKDDAPGTNDDVDAFLLTGGFEWNAGEDWRAVGALDAAISKSGSGDFGNGEFVDAALGFAYRPVTNDRTNGLFTVRYLHDLPGPDQRGADGTTDGDKQRSTILSADINHRITPHWTLGAKYAYRSGETAPRGSDTFAKSTAHLGILRADWHVVHDWDLMLEGRFQRTPETGISRTGGSIAAYRHVHNNIKVGIGYDFGEVSDDISDLNNEERGLFLNVIAKF